MARRLRGHAIGAAALAGVTVLGGSAVAALGPSVAGASTVAPAHVTHGATLAATGHHVLLPITKPAYHRPLGIQPPASKVVHRSAPLPNNAASAPCAATFTAKPCGPLNYLSGPTPGTGLVVSTGGIVGKNTVYAVYWDPTGFPTTFPPTYKNVIDTYLKNVAATSGKPTNVYATDQQYYQMTGAVKQHIHYTVSFGGQITVTEAFPANGCTPSGVYAAATNAKGTTVCLLDKQEATALKTYLATHPTKPKGLGAIYMVFFPPHVETCFTPKTTKVTCSAGAKKTATTSISHYPQTPSYCGYHSATADGATTVLYANMPFPTTTAPCYTTKQDVNGTVNADTMLSTLSHEQNETITDPSNAWRSATGSEIGDLCAYSYGTPLGGTAATGATPGTLYNQTINGTHYFTQLEYSNEDHALTGTKNGCIGSEELPTASFTATVAFEGIADQFTAGASADPDNSTTPLSYTWTWGDGSAKSTGKSPTHSYGATGAYTVTLTVTDGDLWSNTTTKAVTVKATPHSSYLMVASDGGIFTFGNAGYHGSMGGKPLNEPIVDMAATPTGKGYWEVASDGGIFTFGTAGYYGSEGGKPLNKPIVGMAATPTGKGYWEVASDGGIFTFGNAGYYGSEGGKPLNKPIVGMAATPTGKGYWMVASDGGIFTFGTAGYYGSEGGKPLNEPIVGMAANPTGGGYWIVASDGGIFTFGTAGYYGSEGGKPLNKPIVGMAATLTGKGYWMVASDGGIFTFGTAGFDGSEGGKPLNKPIVAMAP